MTGSICTDIDLHCSFFVNVPGRLGEVMMLRGEDSVSARLLHVVTLYIQQNAMQSACCVRMENWLLLREYATPMLRGGCAARASNILEREEAVVSGRKFA